MRIAFLLDDGLDSTDGVQQNILTLGKWLHDQGHEIHFLVGETKRTDIPRVHCLAKNIRVNFNANVLTVPLPAFTKRIREVVNEHRFDVVHVQSPYSPFMSGKVLRASHAHSAVVSTFHILANSPLVTAANYVLGWFNGSSRRYITTQLAVSQPAADFAKRAYGYDCSVLPNPFAYNTFFIKLTAPPDPTYVHVVFLGRLVRRKGIVQLLRAIQCMHRQLPDGVRLGVTIGGKGTMLEELQRYVRDNNLEDVVTFAGFVPEKDKVAFLSQADIAVFPSGQGESFGISLLEAMASARGVVLAGDNPGYRSVMTSQLAEQLVSPDDTAAFAAKLLHYSSSPVARQAAAKIQKTHVKRYDVEMIGPKLLEIYTQALQKHRNKG